MGKHLAVWWDQPRQDFEIVGVVEDTRAGNLNRAANPSVFLCHAQEPSLRASLVARTTGDPLATTSAVRYQIRSVDPEQGVSDVETMDQVVADSMVNPRLQTILISAFGVLALLLACVGLYGVISYSVEQRRREMGLRLALGAAPRSVLRLVLGEGLRLTAVGLIAGFVGALSVTRYLGALLYQVQPTDPRVFTAVFGVLVATATVACYLPARRATQVDPALILREE